MAAQRRSLLQSEQQPSWTDDLPLCHLSGVGTASNRSYSADGKGTESHPPEDSWLKFRSENNCYLYGVFNGYDGNRVTSFVAQRLSAELLLGQLSAEHTEADVRRVLLQAFDVVERSFLESIDDALAEKASLQSQLPEGVPQHQLPPQYQKILERLKALEREISGGAMAVVAVLLNSKLYVANVGTNRALLCKSTVDGLQVTQLNVDHTTENEDELFRLSQLGESGRGRPPWLTLSLLPGGRLGRGRKCLGCDLGLGTSLPGVGSQLCPLLAGDVRNFGSLCLSFPICVMRIVVTPASGPCED